MSPGGAKVGSKAILRETLGGSEGRSISGLPLNGVMIFGPEKIKKRRGKAMQLPSSDSKESLLIFSGESLKAYLA